MCLYTLQWCLIALSSMTQKRMGSLLILGFVTHVVFIATVASRMLLICIDSSVMPLYGRIHS